ncbi:dihydropteroate synthase [Besnoitia besnoiti]|uniref:Dihydropteroate synthase n=1 Tax=Besnoitia besnoiti TaxID=94643 RepID=A0A2A9MN72_BESBE|nr:dihydropteroate synthase [Besnoitia besnoiti]PFH37951.1 dihydropteroate synthase [Besnoitia besnoiti]
MAGGPLQADPGRAAEGSAEESATAYICLGSNLRGEARLAIIEQAIRELRECLGPILSTSCLYETVPAFDVCPPGVPHDVFHPFYLNAVVKLQSRVTDPWDVLEVLKDLEARTGRPLPTDEEQEKQLEKFLKTGAAFKDDCAADEESSADGNAAEKPEKAKYVRGAPRLIDMDLLFLDKNGASCVVDEASSWPPDKKWQTILPHPRLSTRNFVLFPLCDIDPDKIHPVEGVSLKELLLRNLELRRIRLQEAAAKNTATRSCEHAGSHAACSESAPELPYTLDGSLTIPRRCFAATTENLWTLGGLAGVADTLRYIADVKRAAAKMVELLDDSQRTQLSRLLRLEDSLRKEHPVKVMGIVNVSPDSFTDNFCESVDDALEAAERMVTAGADILDVGGEATSPFKAKGEVSLAVERERVIPVIQGIRKRINGDVIVSVDTMKAELAREAVSSGANWVNDQTGEMRKKGSGDPLAFVQDSSTTIVLMHKRGTPDTFDSYCDYEDVVREVGSWLAEMSNALQKNALGRWRILADPGLGISKSPEQSFELLRSARRIREMLPEGIPQLIGHSRKRFIGWGTDEEGPKPPAPPSKEEVEGRRWGGAAVVAWCTANADAIGVIRTHDVKETCLVRNVAEKIQGVDKAIEKMAESPDISSYFSFWK